MRLFIACLLALLHLPLAASADEVERLREDDESIFTFQFENDLFAGDDRQYTNGVRIAWLSPEGEGPQVVKDFADWFWFFPEGGQRRVSLAAGQSIYTPDDITSFTPSVADRPYAGWLYGSAGMISDTGQQYDNLQLTFGIVGPSSLGEQSQKFVHSVLGSGSPDPKGWHTQLKDEPGVVLEYQRGWRKFSKWDDLWGLETDLNPYVGGALGNVFTYAGSGATLRVGHELPADYGPPRIRPSLPGSDFFLSPASSFGWYLFAGLEGRAVARNIFLDGNTWKDSRSVDKYPLVGDLLFGGAITLENTRVALTHVIRSEEFEAQDGPASFTGITVSRRF